LSAAFQALLNDYVVTKYPKREPPQQDAILPASAPASRPPSLRVLA
jgi:hypothetical protein